MKHISKEIIQRITMKEAIDAMQLAFTVISNDEGILPLRTNISQASKDGNILVMPSSAFGITGVKISSLYKNNPSQNLPMTHGLMVIINNETGEPVAMIDSVHLTALRTGAASGLAAELLSRNESKTLGIFGSNEQAEMQILGVIESRAISKIFVFARNKGKTIEFCKKMSAKTGIEILCAETENDLYSCDIICTATNSCNPVFEHQYLKQGTHINAIGSYKPLCREIPADTIIKSKLIVDQRKAALKEAGDILIPLKDRLIDSNHIYAELGEIISGKKSGRISDNEITVFKSVGIAVQDLAIAKLALDKFL